jgi:hypothetical protein
MCGEAVLPKRFDQGRFVGFDFVNATAISYPLSPCRCALCATHRNRAYMLSRIDRGDDLDHFRQCLGQCPPIVLLGGRNEPGIDQGNGQRGFINLDRQSDPALVLSCTVRALAS